MTISSTQDKITYLGNGSSTSFAIPFQMGNLAPLSSFVEVWLRDENVTPATESLWANPADYSVSGTNVVAVVAPASGTKLLIKRKIPLTQLLSYLQNVNFPIADHEGAIDKLTLAFQYLAEVVARCAKLPNTNAISDLALPEPVAGEMLAWNGTATGLMNANSGNLGFLTALLAQDSQVLANNQGAQADITNLLFDGTLITSVVVFYEIHRTTTLAESFTNGILNLMYKNNSWEVEDGLIVGDLSGITFSVVTTGTSGQVKYTSTNMSGAGHVGRIKWRTITFS